MIKQYICPEQLCVGCGACAQKCPENAISMEPDYEGFLRPQVNNSCIYCGVCKKVCPQNSELLNYSLGDCYAVQYKDKSKLEFSSSGGVFAWLADYVLEAGGVICGAIFDDAMTVRHISTDNSSCVSWMQGSKYVQSQIGNCFYDTKEYLDMGRLVLFSGTPCQIAGLKSYLGYDPENLITLDIVCSGVQSPLLFHEFIKDLERRKRSKVVDLKFRDKQYCGCSNTTTIYLKKGEKIKKQVIKNRKDVSYYVAFGQQKYLRKSCYGCRYNSILRVSDFTCGDYVGKNESILMLDEKQGISILFVNSEKGKKIFSSQKDRLRYIASSFDVLSEGNQMIYSSKPLELRTPEMFDYLIKNGYKKTSEKFFPIRKFGKIKDIIPKKIKSLVIKAIQGIF